MKHLLLALLVTLGSVSVAAQTSDRDHRIVMQLTSGDTLVHKGLMKQLRNMKEAAPTMQLEVVCHGAGMDILMTDRSVVLSGLEDAASMGIFFLACENTIKERKLDRSLIVPQSGFVKAGIIYIVERQEQGWSYIKAGF